MTAIGGANVVAQLTKQQRCSLPPVEPSVVNCRAFIPSWAFNSATGACESFVYGGCGATANLFETLAQCNVICGPEPSRKTIIINTHFIALTINWEKGITYVYNDSDFSMFAT